MTILPYTTKSKFIFDLRGEMAATTTNKVSSLSQAHFDEILVLVEHDSTCKTILQQLQDVLILVLVEHDSYIGEVVLGLLVVLILVLMEIAACELLFVNG